MRFVLIALLWASPFPTGVFSLIQESNDWSYDVRARENLFFGTGASTGLEYYDVAITSQPSDGVLIKLPYTQQGGKLTFDLHHRVGLSQDFGLPAEIMTVVEVLTGSTNRLGTYTMLDMIGDGAEFDEMIERASDAEIDRYVTPMSRKTITIETQPGPQSISIVGRDLNITRQGMTTRVNTPGTRIAMVSNIKFEEVREVNPLRPSDQ
jgi:hypothetical protein